MSEFPELDKLVEDCDPKTKLAIAAWVFEHIVAHAKEGGSFRYLIYHRLGFGIDAYVPLYYAGGMDISNEFDMERMESIKKLVKEHKIEKLKEVCNLCDEPDCFENVTCGTPVNENLYRCTCFEHRPKRENE